MEPLLWKVLALALLWALWRPVLRGTTLPEALGCLVIALAILVVLAALSSVAPGDPWVLGF
jgi:hypothetical protein